MSSSSTLGGRHIFNYLNVIPRDDASYEDTFDPNDLSQYTEAKFFDFDMGQPVDEVVSKKDTNMRGVEPAIASIDLGLKGGAMDFIDFDNFDFQTFGGGPNEVPALSPAAIGVPPAMASIPSSISSASSSPAPFSPGPIRGSKRKASQEPSVQPDSFEEASRLAAEEDKRRRNTAASARFRVKKKQREQALERTAKEMSDKCSALEQRISQLEMENKWLKNLITEKNSAEDASEVLAARYSAAVANGDISMDSE